MTEILELMLLLTVGTSIGFVLGSLATTQYRVQAELEDARNEKIGYRKAARKEEARIANILKSL